MIRTPDFARRAFGGLPGMFWAVAIGTFINSAGEFVVTFLSIYLTEARDLSSSTAGLIVSVFGVGLSAGALAGGFSSDRLGRRRTMTLVLATSAVILVCLGRSRQLVLIVSLALLYGIAKGAFSPAAGAFVSDVIDGKDRVRAYGLIYWVYNAGCGVGVTLAGLIAGAYGFTFLFWGDAATSLAAATIVAVFVAETRPRLSNPQKPAAPKHDLGIKGLGAITRDAIFLRFLGIRFVYEIIYIQYLVALALDMRAHGISMGTYGVCMALNAVCVIVLQPFVSPWLERFRSSAALAAAMLLTGASYGLYATSTATLAYAAGIVLMTFAEIAIEPLASTIVADLSPAALRGRFRGAYSAMDALAVMVGPWLGASVWEHYGRNVLWLGLFGLAAAAAVWMLTMGPALERRVKELRTQAADAPG